VVCGEDADTGEGGFIQVACFPVDGGAAFAGFFDGQQRLGLLISMLGAELIVFGTGIGDEGRLENWIEQVAHHADRARGVQHMDDGLRIAESDLNGRMRFASGCAATHIEHRPAGLVNGEAP
jgi:hypothetical protein